jgi:hypothetical protein
MVNQAHVDTKDTSMKAAAESISSNSGKHQLRQLKASGAEAESSVCHHSDKLMMRDQTGKSIEIITTRLIYN